jgi:hypothetical protein
MIVLFGVRMKELPTETAVEHSVNIMAAYHVTVTWLAHS